MKRLLIVFITSLLVFSGCSKTAEQSSEIITEENEAVTEPVEEPAEEVPLDYE